MEATPGDMGARGVRPPNIRASKFVTTTGGCRRCMSSPSSELEEELGESTTCHDLLDLQEVSASTATMLVLEASAVSESDQEVEASTPEAARCSTSVVACTGSVLSSSCP
ncbi:hypothetical protein MRB53_026395 [Persea americana]|uniref:Uncharacterized protein n=1 Tax=Persea americana TaxID=3435 RepID=A0ACC2LJ54_PERAE|nr:hypothetical protein MRB53_026395 [Persea americana]